MPSSNQVPEQRVDPLMPAERLVHWLSAPTVHVAVGLVLGLIVARQMRRRHLHWSWAAGAVALVVLARQSLGCSALIAAVAALCAALRGRRWHRQDIDAGSDLTEIAALRRRPWDLLSAAARTAVDRCTSRIGAPSELILGHDERRRAVPVPFGGADGGRHTLVVGATGSGKTVTQTWMAVSAIERGMGAIVVDPKGDSGMREELRRAAHSAGRRFLEWTPAGDCIYNPYASGSETEIADKVLAGEHFTEPHYLRQAQRYLGHVVRALRMSAAEISLREIVDRLEPARLEMLVRSLPEHEAKPTFAYLDSLTARQQRDLAGVRDRLAIMVESDVGPWLDARTAGVTRLELLEAVRARAVVCFRLESDSRPLLTQMLGAAIVQDLQTTVAALQGCAVPTMVVIDEFSAVAADQVVRLFGRARSAGVSLLLGTQELSDLRPPGRERLLEQVMGNLSVLIAHRQVVPGSAELIAGVAGTEGAWKVSHYSDGRTTRTRTREPVLDPSRIMSLGPGWGAVIVLGAGGGVRITRVCSSSAGR